MAIYGINNNYEILDESRVIYFKQDNVGIAVDGDGDSFRDWGHDPYFKVFIGSNVDSCDLLSRIYFRRYLYVYPEHDGPEVWYFNSKEMKQLMKYLTKPGVWTAIINKGQDMINRYIEKYKPVGLDIFNYSLLDYTNLPDRQTAKDYGNRWNKMSGYEKDKIKAQYTP